MSKITYANKVALNENAEIPDINKITDDDMNEIKAVVNNNDDELITINTKLTNIAELIKSSQGSIEIGDTQIIYGAVIMTFQPGENSQTIQFKKSFADNNYIVVLTFQNKAAYYTFLSPVVYEKNTTNVRIGAFNSHTGNVSETLGYIIIGKI